MPFTYLYEFQIFSIKQQKSAKAVIGIALNVYIKLGELES